VLDARRSAAGFAELGVRRVEGAPVWEQFFLDFFDYSAESIGVVVYAGGCREGWLQGELYRAGWRRGLRVNEYTLGGGKKVDLCCRESPRMVAEVKVVGADYEGKMRYAIDSDVRRLAEIPDADLERYMVLVIPNSEAKSSLGDYLGSVCYSPYCVEREYPQFHLRLWRLEAVAPTLTLQQNGPP
jgi:hypothetical protein